MIPTSYPSVRAVRGAISVPTAGQPRGKGRSDEGGEAPRPAALPASLAHRTGLLLYKVAQFAQDALDRSLQPLGLKTRHYSVLAVLAQQAPLSQHAVGRKLRIDPATMVAVVDDLERLGLVRRARDPGDRRVYELSLTDAGRPYLRDLDALVDRVEADLLAPLDDRQRAELHALLTGLLAP